MNWVLRGLAATIDLLQFLFFILFLGFATMTPVGGGIVGGAAGASICYSASGNVVSGAINAAYCAVVGAGIGAFALPVGVAIDIAISSTSGVLLIAALWATGRFSLMAVLIGFSSEMLPGINGFVPGWSILVHRCIYQYNAAKKGGAPAPRASLSIISTAARLVPALGGGTAAALVRSAPKGAGPQDRAQPSPARVAPLLTKNFDGIRPATTPHEATA